MLAAPIPILRMPALLSPSVYAGFIGWTVFCANPCMLVYAYSFEGEPTLDFRTAATVLGVATFISALGMVCTLISMPQEHRASFYKHCTYHMHLRDWNWNQTIMNIDGVLVECEPELVRACVGMSYARCYWPDDLVRPFVRENW